MRSRFLTKGLTALTAIAALGLASRASANEPAVYTGVDTTYVNADSLRIQRNIRAGETSVKPPINGYTPLPQGQTEGRQGISKYLPRQACFVIGAEAYDGPDNQFPENDFAVVGLEVRLTDPSPVLPGTLWLITSLKGGHGGSDNDYNERGSVGRIGGEFRSNTPIMGIAGCGLDITTSSIRRYDRGKGFYGNAGFGFGPLPLDEEEDISTWPRGLKMMFGGSSTKGKDVSFKFIWSLTD